MPGPSGRGLTDYFDLDSADVDLWVGNLEYALAGQVAFLAGNKRIVQFARHHLTDGSPNPGSTAAAVQALRTLNADSKRTVQLRDNIETLREALQQQGLISAEQRLLGPVVPVSTGNTLHTLQFAQRLLDSGVLVRTAVPPEVEENHSAILLYPSALHTAEQLTRLAAQISQLRATNGQTPSSRSGLTSVSR